MNLTKTIVKALIRTQGQDIQAQAEEVARYIDIAQDIEGDSDIRYRTYSPQPIRNASPLIVLPSTEAEEPPPIRPVATQSGEDDSQWTDKQKTERLDALYRKFEQHAPPVLPVVLTDGTKINLTRKLKRLDQQFMKGCDLMYLAQGAEEGPRDVVLISDGDVDVEEKIRGLVEAAKTLYSSKQRHIEARRPNPISNHLDDVLKSAPSADSDGYDASGAAAEWAATRSQEAKLFLQGRK